MAIDGTVTVADEDVDKVTMVDDYQPHDVVISKQDINGDELPGALLEVTGRETGSAEDITPVTWASGDENKTISLKPGTYTLHESGAPENYVVASDITFTVAIDGTVTVADEDVDKVTMVDDYQPHDVVISKRDINGDELPGASLEVTGRETGSAEDIIPITWTSGETDKSISLKPGIYTLHESGAPENYVIASDITFVVAVDGTVTVADEDVDKVIMVDEYAVHEVSISKADENGVRINGAGLTITGREAGADEDMEPLAISSSASAATVIELRTGSYTLAETSTPDGYRTADPVSFTVSLDGTVTVGDAEADEVVMTDLFEKQDLIVTKTVTGNLGNRTKEFTFRLVLEKGAGAVMNLPEILATVKTDAGGSAIEGAITFSDGIGTFTLAHGEQVTINDIPYGMKYRLEEFDTQDYRVSSTNASGTITTDPVTATFINTRNAGIPTLADIGTPVLVAVAGVILMVLLILFGRKKRNA